MQQQEEMHKILVVEPYFGGSHKQFLLGLQENIEAEFTFLTLPPRKWKMRMQLAAPWFADCLAKLEDKRFDTVLCSTFVDVAVFKGLVAGLPGWNQSCRFCTYFHENQFVYPMRHGENSRNQFTTINYTTALASDGLAFNSLYNFETFLSGCRKYIRKTADCNLKHTLDAIAQKSSVIYPGIDFTGFAENRDSTCNSPPIICWNHRWEHDKNPESFFIALDELDKQGYAFEFVVLGQSFQNIPSVFQSARKRFARRIVHFGYADSREEYISLLQRCDIVVSTALHEFFGIAVIEAIRAGCMPLLPNSLSYPELYPDTFLYKEGELVQKLASLLKVSRNYQAGARQIDTNRFSWENLKTAYQQWLLTSD
jgi:glycosyltransferase involved in cell wall biosynthesis